MSPTVITSLLACTAAALAATLGFAWWRQRARLLETERQLAEFSRVVSVLRLAQASDATAAETAHATPPPSPENLALGPLAREVAHDLNNVLAVVSTMTEVLLMELASENTEPDADRLESSLLQIQAAGQRGAGLARRLLIAGRRAAPPAAESPGA